jgi:hypothetical protein
MNDLDPIESARTPWAGWTVAIAHGGRYLGRIVDKHPALELCPVYELNVQLLREPNTDGGVGVRILYHATPILFLSGWTSMLLPEDALICLVERLPLPERQRLMSAAQQAAQIVEDIKREQSPIAQQPRIVVPGR